jgi:mediator of RNA polymerase II transcription subunit 17
MGALPTLIERIDQQRGGFRNITEESLRQEIAEEEAAAAAGEDHAVSDGGEREPDRLKALMEARAEMLHNIQ